MLNPEAAQKFILIQLLIVASICLFSCADNPQHSADGSSADSNNDSLNRHEPGWVLSWGGTDNENGSDTAVALALDPDGNVYVTGGYKPGTDLDPSNGTAIVEVEGEGIYLSKFNSSGQLLWAKTWSMYAGRGEFLLETDGQGNVYLAGGFYLTVDFNPGSEILEITSNGGIDAFLLKLDSQGTFQWVRTWGGRDENSAVLGDFVRGISIIGEQAIFVVGEFSDEVDVDPGPLEYIIRPSAVSSIFLSKFNLSGELLFSTYFDCTDRGIVEGLAESNESNTYVLGGFTGEMDFVPGTGTNIAVNESESQLKFFLCKVDINGNVGWVKTDLTGRAFSIAASPNGSAYIIGSNTMGSVDHQDTDRALFLSKYTTDGEVVSTSLFGEGSYLLIPTGIGSDENGNILICGYSEGVYSRLTQEDFYTAFAYYIPIDSLLVSPLEFASINPSIAFAVAADSAGGWYLAGSYTGELEILSMEELNPIRLSRGGDAFLARVNFDN